MINLFSLPNLVTLASLALGTSAILLVLRGQIFTATLLLPLAVMCDFFDGAVARALKKTSVLGAQLDSLADLVSFGVAPAVVLFEWLKGGWLTGIILVILVLCGALRLARFNAEHDPDKPTVYYTGVPITMNGLLIPLFVWAGWPSWVVLGAVLVISGLMVSRVRVKKIKFF
jgi:CDP-diacylglycerol--serine O-phosphatidyltransferase